ncbi:MAG: glgB [Myxococcaceae bacterium]|nr:glgB [Myxococcaceae bacterium]
MRQPQSKEQVDQEIRRVVALAHPDPHSVLGVHEDGDGVVVRAFRPDAEAIAIFPDFGGSIPMEHRQGGVFEARLNNRREVFSYLLEVRYPGGRVFRLRDPYSFAPTLGEMDLYFAGQGRHERLWERMGAHPIHHGGHSGVAFAVWAPTADGVSVVGDFNSWDGRLHPMRSLGASGIWELFIPDVSDGARYKFEIRPRGGGMPFLKSDPFGFRMEHPPLTASVVHNLGNYRWHDSDWMTRRTVGIDGPVSIYELHAASWKRVPEEDHRALTWRELAVQVADHAVALGFTHVELMPVAEHPFGGSWGYQVGGYYAPTARHGHPDDFRFFVDHLHSRGLGVIIDWVPGHFPRDAFALANFDGTSLYEHSDPRQGAHPDWGTLIFNFGRNEVRNFLLANALFWLAEYHVDGLRVDAVASMLYLDYSRREGEWVPNMYGGRENLEVIGFLREFNELVRRNFPTAMVLAEESTAWPGVSRPVSEGGLGFTHKWNMGWMHDTLKYFSKDPIHRQHHHHDLTFGLLYAFSENFVLPLSHDEVVHGKGALVSKMPGDEWQRFANLRALYAWMWCHPGKKLLFMGGEFGQTSEWKADGSLDWHLLQYPIHARLQDFLSRLNALYRAQPALHQIDFHPDGFRWVQADMAELNTYAFIRRSRSEGQELLVVANLSPLVREDYRVGCPSPGIWRELLSSDAREFGGSGVTNEQTVAESVPWDGQPASLRMRLPPLGVSIWQRA